MKEFDAMWEGVQDKVTDTVFRMEEEEGFQESVWTIGAAIHESAPRPMADTQHAGQQTPPSPTASAATRSPSRSATAAEKVGRNEPCPCGSGKKYKNCHMRQAAV